MRRLNPLPWFKAHPTVADALLALALLAPGLTAYLAIDPREVAVPGDYREPDALGAVLLVVAALAVTFRRRWPVAVYVVVVAAGLPFWALGYLDTTNSVVTILALYSVAAHRPRRVSLPVAGFTLLVVLVVVVASADVTQVEGPGGVVPFVLSNSGIVVGAWAVGDGLQNRRRLVEELRLRAETAEALQEESAARAVQQERTAIARELHDVVAHAMSVMVVQAGGARRMVGKDPARAAEALAQVEATGRQALEEMRRMLGVLREEGHGGGRTPQPGLHRIQELVEHCAAAGVPVEVVVRGEPRPLPPGEDLAAFRIAQEALTNVLKHAGPATATLTVTWEPGRLVLEVVDDGRGAAADPPAPGDGHGIRGMGERADLYGGEVHAGPRPGGGFAVRAVLPTPGAGSAAVVGAAEPGRR